MMQFQTGFVIHWFEILQDFLLTKIQLVRLATQLNRHFQPSVYTQLKGQKHVDLNQI